MTDFQRLRLRKRIISIIFFVDGSAFVATMIGTAYLGLWDWIWLPGIVGLGIALATLTAANFIVFYCPNCRANLAAQFMNSITGRPGRFCQYCGIDLDASRARS